MKDYKNLYGKQSIVVCGKTISAYFFGQNNYSGELNPFTVYPDDIKISDLLSEENVYLNPFAKPNSCEIFCLAGTQKEYDDWYRDAFESYCTQEAVRRHPEINIWNNPTKEQMDILHNEENVVASTFIPWYKH